MASILGKLPPPPLFNGARRPLLINLQKVELAASRGKFALAFYCLKLELG